MPSGGAARSGDGWHRLSDGRVVWGRFGAAGMLLRHVDHDGVDRFLLARRASWVHRGNGQWSVPGGAIDADEEPVAAALREFDEEIGRLPDGWRLVGIRADVVDDGTWTYYTCCAHVDERPTYDATLSPENDEAGWFTRADLAELDLFEPFARQLPALLDLFGD